MTILQIINCILLFIDLFLAFFIIKDKNFELKMKDEEIKLLRKYLCTTCIEFKEDISAEK